MISAKYLSPYLDHSGYGQASRSFIAALSFAGVDIVTEFIAQTPEKASYGWLEGFASSLKDRTIDYKIKFLHVTPDLYPKYMEKGKYHIGHLFFEVDQLPKAWVEPCNKLQEIWTASTKQAEMIKKSGVTVPIHCFPQPIDVSKFGRAISPYKIPDFEGTLFFSIFQWIERKNPKTLLQTYWKTFSGKEDVGLLIKSYGVTYGENEFQRIKDDIKAWKAELNLAHYPKVFITKKLFSTEEIFRIHLTGDCFVTTSHGEGWQVPVAEAGLMGKPIIGIDKTGIFDYLSKEDYYSCSTKESKVIESPNIPWYESYMKWLDINEKELSENMLSVYSDKLLAKNKGLKTQEYIKENFNYNKVGMTMKKRLEEIYRFL